MLWVCCVCSHVLTLWLSYHEAVLWDALLRLWIVLPRKASSTVAYDPRVDETCCGTNLLLLCSEECAPLVAVCLYAYAWYG